MTLLANLAMDAEVAPVSRLSVVKAALRLHREEFAAAAAAEAAEAAKAAEKTSRDAARDGVGPEPEPDVEVVAEKSLEELEMEKLDRAREDGNYLDLTSSQGEVETITTPERPKRDEPSNPPKSFLACHARVGAPGAPHRRRGRVAPRGVSRTPRHTPRGGRGDARVRRRVDDRRSRREFDAESDPESEPESESGDCVRDGTGIRKRRRRRRFANSSRTSSRRVPLETPSRSARTSLWWCSFPRASSPRLFPPPPPRPRTTPSRSTARRRRHRPVLDAVVRLIQSNGEGEDDRLSRSCGIQILGALAMRGTIDLGAPVPLVRHAGVDASPGYPVDERSDAALVCAGTVGCLMRPGDTTGRPLHSAAASLLGVALAQHAAAASRRAEGSGRDGGEDDMDVDTDARTRTTTARTRTTGAAAATVAFARRNLGGRSRYAAVFANSTTGVPTTRSPSPPSESRGATPRFYPATTARSSRGFTRSRFASTASLVSWRSRRCVSRRGDPAAGAAFAERALPELGVILSARDPQVHALTLKTLAAILPSLKEEASRWPHGKRGGRRKVARRGDSGRIRAVERGGRVRSRSARGDVRAALADAAPALREHPAVRAPLLRALASARGEPAGALAHWNENASGRRDATSLAAGSDAETGGRDEGLATAGHVGRRLRAALRVLPTAPGFRRRRHSRRGEGGGLARGDVSRRLRRRRENRRRVSRASVRG